MKLCSLKTLISRGESEEEIKEGRKEVSQKRRVSLKRMKIEIRGGGTIKTDGNGQRKE